MYLSIFMTVSIFLWFKVAD